MSQTIEYIQTLARFPFALQKMTQRRLTLDEAVKRLGLTPDVAKKTVDSDLQDNTRDQNSAMTTENVQYTLDLLASTKALTSPMKAEDVADLSYLNAVPDEMGRK